MSTKIKFDLRNSKQEGLSNLNDIFAEAGKGSRFGYDALNILKKDNMIKVKNIIEKLLIDHKLNANDLMFKDVHLFIEVHTATKASDLDNISVVTKWITDVLEGIRVNINTDDGTLDYIGYYPSHSSKTKKENFPGIPFLGNDNQKIILSINTFSGVCDRKNPHINFVYSNNWTEFEFLLLQMLKQIKKASL